MSGSISILRGCSDLEQPPLGEGEGGCPRLSIPGASGQPGKAQAVGWVVPVGCSGPQACP